MPLNRRRASLVLALGLALSPAVFAQSVDQALEQAETLKASAKYDDIIRTLAPYRDLARPAVDYALASAHLNRRLQAGGSEDDFAEALRLANRAAAREQRQAAETAATHQHQ
jgi:hypothetical protein